MEAQVSQVKGRLPVLETGPWVQGYGVRVVRVILHISEKYKYSLCEEKNCCLKVHPQILFQITPRDLQNGRSSKSARLRASFQSLNKGQNRKWWQRRRAEADHQVQEGRALEAWWSVGLLSVARKIT